ncbi:unnamed protein product [Sphagnum balticum]
MYNDRFQYGQRINTSGYGSDSYYRPSAPLRQPEVSAYRPSNSQPSNDFPASNAQLIQKIEALFPYMEDIVGQNDNRTNQIINKLLGLRESLEGVFSEIEQELDQTENENVDLKNKIKKAELNPKTTTVTVEDVEARKKLEREVERLRRDNQALKDREAQARENFLTM